MEVEKVTAQADESGLKPKGVKKRKGRSGSDQEEEWIRQFDLLDAALRCSICHDCIDTPLLVRTCGHSCECFVCYLSVVFVENALPLM
jgi:hypothetical protein